MARTKRNPEFEIRVVGELYLWRLQRQHGWSCDAAGWRGMAIAVRHKQGQREAVVEFPPAGPPRLGAPLLQPAKIPSDIVANAIASAIAGGWEPLSRGKTVTVVVDQTGLTPLLDSYDARP